MFLLVCRPPTGCIVLFYEERLYLRNYKWDYVAICEWTTPLAMESNSTLVEEKTVLRSRQAKTYFVAINHTKTTSHTNTTENADKGDEYAFKDVQGINLKVSFVNLLVNLQFLRLQFT